MNLTQRSGVICYLGPRQSDYLVSLMSQSLELSHRLWSEWSSSHVVPLYPDNSLQPMHFVQECRSVHIRQYLHRRWDVGPWTLSGK